MEDYKNPLEGLGKQTAEVNLGNVISELYMVQAITSAKLNAVLSNQAKILSLLEDRDLDKVIEEIGADVDERIKEHSQDAAKSLGFSLNS